MFLSLNPTIRSHLTEWIDARFKDRETVDRRVRKLSNLISVCFLYAALALNVNIPKDYLLIYLYMTYYGELNPPSSKIIVLPTTEKWMKVSKLRKSSLVRRLYNKKHFVIFPAIFGQILSHYLTPTKYRRNHKYLSGFIKTRILNPIWINFSMGATSHSMNWMGLAISYARHNLLLLAYYGFVSFKDKVVDQYYELRHGSLDSDTDMNLIVRNYVTYILHKANAMANFMYGPNVISMFLLALTAPLLTSVPAMQRFYVSDFKRTIKNYFKVIGFGAALGTMVLNSMNLIPDVFYKHSGLSKNNIREIGSSFYDELNKYLLRLMVLSKWRIVKENHPWFTTLKVGTWEKLESLVMCYGVWKLMNLNDFTARNQYGLVHAECQRLRSVPLMRGIDKIMN